MKDKERPNIPHENPIFDSKNSQDIFPSGITKKSDYEFFIETTRPEDTYDKASDYFSIDKVQKYAESKSIMRIQEKITKRVIEIADIPAPAVILDLGIGSGFSTIYMYLRGYRTVGVDINSLFLSYYHNTEINPIQSDMSLIGFRKHSFDLVVSVSAVQWLFSTHINGKQGKTNETLRIKRFAKECDFVLKPKGKIVIQFYPKSNDQMHLLGHEFLELGNYEGGFIIDNPKNPKKRKVYLSLLKVKA